MKRVVTFQVDQVSDHGYHRLQVSLKTSFRTPIADRLQQLFENPDEVCGASSREAHTSAVKTLCRLGHKQIFNTTYKYDDLVIDWLEYRSESGGYCEPYFKIETRSVKAFRTAHGWLSRIARSLAKARNRDFDSNCFTYLLKDPTIVLATLRRLPSFVETETVNIEGTHFIVDKVNPAVDQEEAAQ